MVNPGSSAKSRGTPARLFVSLKDQKVLCNLCSHHCVIENNNNGYCNVRFNDQGKLFTKTYGMAAGLAIDPIEKKPFFHFKPGSSVLSFGTPGCNFRCLNCQNWDLSQAPRESGVGCDPFNFTPVSPEQIVTAAINHSAHGYAYTYSEPTIFYEYARDCVLEARKRASHQFHLFVSNGYFSRQMLDEVIKEELLKGIRIDLKFIRDDKYQEITGAKSFRPVIENIKRVFESGIHLEVINLVIPGLNDSESDLADIVAALRSISPSIPLHFSAFHPDFKLRNLMGTPLSTLERARKVAKESGMEHVFIGNVSGDGLEDTCCPKCSRLLVQRRHFTVIKNEFSRLSAEQKKDPCCPFCGQSINIVL